MREYMRTTVLLDTDGVLLDETGYENIVCEIIVKILNETLGNDTPTHYWNDVKESIGKFCPSTPRFVLWKRINPDIDKYKNVLNLFNLTFSKQKPTLKLYDGIADELHKLRKHFKLLIAGQYGKSLGELLSNNNLINLFENSLTQDDFNITKPDPRYFEQIAYRAKINPENCIMVGDRIDKDVIPARQNNMGTVFLRTGIYRNQKPRIPEEFPDLILESVVGMASQIESYWNS